MTQQTINNEKILVIKVVKKLQGPDTLLLPEVKAIEQELEFKFKSNFKVLEKVSEAEYYHLLVSSDINNDDALQRFKESFINNNQELLENVEIEVIEEKTPVLEKDGA